MSIPAFDAEKTPLASNTALLEASAGTGKTHTIAELVLRFVVERDLRIDEILVTTFTELATAELRARIRKRLREEYARLREAETAALPDGWPERDEVLRRVDVAIRTFDEAPISTIHGFCQRILRDRAFESGLLFDAELITDDSALLREVTDDFWRRRFHRADETTLAAIGRAGITTEELGKLLDDLKNSPTAEILPRTSEADLDAAQREVVATWEELRTNWPTWEDEVRKIFRDAPWAAKNRRQGKPATMALSIDRLSAMLECPRGTGEEAACLADFRPAAMESATKKNETTPTHPLFPLCERILALEPRYAMAVQAVFCEWALAELPRRKLARNVLSFDDLLSRLDAALSGADGERLAKSIRSRYRAVLLDEFQDTDPVQECIFRRIYGNSDVPVYLIGDPKQAIYGFRGADVFAYLDAARNADSQFTLDRNWRSETPLVDAVNAVFSTRPDAFLIDGIAFRPVGSSGMADAEHLTFNGERRPSLHIWKVESGETKKGLHDNVARPRIARATAAAIGRVLASGATIGAERVCPGHIAVLVNNRYEARPMQEALAALGVPSVLSGAARVYDSPEAGELQRILAAVAEPGREDFLRSALTTDLLGRNASDLEAFGRDESGWNGVLERFVQYHALWKSRGFIVMLRTLLLDFGVRARLLSLHDGERRLTNVLHLAELVQTECVSRRLGIAEVQKWLANQLQDRSGERDETVELRLERDDEAVRILTVHSSKGLEFGIVFCPFVWVGARTPRGLRADRIGFHEDGRKLAFGAAAEKYAEVARREQLAERVRLFYVALTRAKHQCTMVWGDFASGKESAPGHLFETCEPEKLPERCPSIRVESLPDEAAPSYRPDAASTDSLKARTFHGTIDRTWGISSFTGLTRDHVAEPEVADVADDEVPEPLAETGPLSLSLSGIAAFPRGTKPGTCLHEIFEALDFTRDADIAPLVSRKLRAFSLSGQEDVVVDAVRRTLAVSLDGTDPKFALSRIGRAARMTELEFHFPVNDLTAERLSAFPGDGWRLSFPPLNGFLKGFIDLVFARAGRFHIVDWKSNWLGPTPESYTPDALAAEMQRSHYGLQLHLYTVALHRYLALRLPDYDYDTHFGGVFYVFLRGVDPAKPELGIYRERPEAESVEELSALFGGGGDQFSGAGPSESADQRTHPSGPSVA